MARLIASGGIDLTLLSAIPNTPFLAQADKSHVALTYYGSTTVDFRGSGIQYNDNYALTGGTITSIVVTGPDNISYTVDGFSSSAVSLNQSFLTGRMIDQLFGQNPTIAGTSFHDVLIGGSGHSNLTGGDGADRLLGGEGNDHLYGQSAAGGPDGADEIVGGGGGDYIQGNAGNDTLYGGGGSDRINGGANNDQISGNTGNDTINGNLGDDVISAGGGNDFARGGRGDDIILGGYGSDTLMGDLGNDTLWANYGDDVLYGGPGADVFQLTGGFAPFGQIPKTVIVADFEAGIDRIVGDPNAELRIAHANDVDAAYAIFLNIVTETQGRAMIAVGVGSDTYLFSGDATLRFLNLAPEALTHGSFTTGILEPSFTFQNDDYYPGP